ncbi:hypothetical protein RCC89_19440 [Cytophagaceae bacterium ABcell3]|nr:hypothetical protein RCC89_19440 [Cytophagaceae bacterium ABcell3]
MHYNPDVDGLVKINTIVKFGGNAYDVYTSMEIMIKIDAAIQSGDNDAYNAAVGEGVLQGLVIAAGTYNPILGGAVSLSIFMVQYELAKLQPKPATYIDRLRRVQLIEPKR